MNVLPEPACWRVCINPMISIVIICRLGGDDTDSLPLPNTRDNHAQQLREGAGGAGVVASIIRSPNEEEG